MTNSKRLALAFFVFTFAGLTFYFAATFGPIALAGAAVVGILGVLAIKNV